MDQYTLHTSAPEQGNHCFLEQAHGREFLSSIIPAVVEIFWKACGMETSISISDLIV